jgi:hypothetical protein
MRILVVEDDKSFLEGLVPLLRALGNNIEITSSE